MIAYTVDEFIKDMYLNSVENHSKIRDTEIIRVVGKTDHAKIMTPTLFKN